jgi:multidrug efflux pump subunit AcrA (membrane-fusion protein)
MMAGKIKVLLIGVCAAAVTVTGTVGGLKTYRSLHKKPVKVYALREVAMTDYMDEGDSMTGSIMTEGLQNVYLSETQTVRQIFVSAGQQVKKGDPLLSFDTTLSEIEVRKAEIEVSRNKLSLSKAEKSLEKLKKTKPYEPKEDISGSRLLC